MKIVTSREKLVEKNIKWGQAYTEKTQFLKEQFEATVGPGSYFRFEGTDQSSGDSYYCIVGPAKVHDPKAKFFAGVRKLPATYSAGGKYFDSLSSAAAYARDTWGITTPKELVPYTADALVGLSPKVTAWKEQREAEEEAKEHDGKIHKDPSKKKKSKDKKKDKKKDKQGKRSNRKRSN